MFLYQEVLISTFPSIQVADTFELPRRQNDPAIQPLLIHKCRVIHGGDNVPATQMEQQIPSRALRCLCAVGRRRGGSLKASYISVAVSAGAQGERLKPHFEAARRMFSHGGGFVSAYNAFLHVPTGPSPGNRTAIHRRLNFSLSCVLFFIFFAVYPRTSRCSVLTMNRNPGLNP